MGWVGTCIHCSLKLYCYIKINFQKNLDVTTQTNKLNKKKQHENHSCLKSNKRDFCSGVKQHFIATTGMMCIWTHRDYNSMQKTCTSSTLTNISTLSRRYGQKVLLFLIYDVLSDSFYLNNKKETEKLIKYIHLSSSLAIFHIYSTISNIKKIIRFKMLWTV